MKGALKTSLSQNHCIASEENQKEKPQGDFLLKKKSWDGLKTKGMCPSNCCTLHNRGTQNRRGRGKGGVTESRGFRYLIPFEKMPYRV